jgi:hypothetical protein
MEKAVHRTFGLPDEVRDYLCGFLAVADHSCTLTRVQRLLFEMPFDVSGRGITVAHVA